MKRSVFAILAVLLSTAFASAPDTLWTRAYGGANDDVGRSMQLTADGGCIIAGYTLSFGAGGSDVWLLKIDAQGDTEWTRTYGGSSDDEAYSVDLTFDGGYIVAGMTRSYDAGWLLRLTATGDTEWTRTFGGSSNGFGHSVRQVADSGYVVAGRAWPGQLLKYDALGDTVWTRAVGAGHFHCVRQATNGDFLLAGYDGYEGGDHCRTDSAGNLLWTRRTALWGDLYGVALRPDNGSVVVGTDGSSFLFLEAYDSLGNRSWGKGFRPHPSYAFGNSVERAGDGYFAVGGFSFAGDDIYLVRVNLNGDSLWTKVIGGDSEDIGYAGQQTADSGFVVAGSTRSFGAGGSDVWLIRLEPEQIGIHEMPNDETRMTNGGPTILPLSNVQSLESMVIFDAMGRRTANPKPGVYFVREARAQAQAQTVRKVVVTR